MWAPPCVRTNSSSPPCCSWWPLSIWYTWSQKLVSTISILRSDQGSHSCCTLSHLESFLKHSLRTDNTCRARLRYISILWRCFLFTFLFTLSPIQTCFRPLLPKSWTHSRLLFVKATLRLKHWVNYNIPRSSNDQNWYLCSHLSMQLYFFCRLNSGLLRYWM